MIFKNIIRIIKSYKFILIKIIFFEIIYFLRGYKGNKFNFSNKITMAHNIPCPYYFLVKIKKVLRNEKFDTFIDLGCGSGRIIDFFNKNIPNKNFVGIEYFSAQYEYCKKIFNENNNIFIKKEDFLNYDFLQHESDCYYFNNPFKTDSDILEIVNKIVKNNNYKKKILFIFVNFNKKVLENIENVKFIESYYINENKGYSIYCV
jgi:tRNA G46 methylase TrmB